MKVKRTRIAWTPGEHQLVMTACQKLKQKEPNTPMIERWKLAQTVLPEHRRRNWYSSTLKRFEEALKQFQMATPKASLLTPQAATADEVRLIHFRTPGGCIIGIDERMTIAEMTMLGILVKVLAQ